MIDDGKYVCKRCGQVMWDEYTKKYVDFYEEMYKIRRKSVYNRKYHIENLITDICTTNRIEIARDEINRICKIFDKIDRILPQVNHGQERMISVKFVLQ